MEIKAEIKQVMDGSKPTKAYADVLIDNSIVIHGIRVVEKEGSRHISMPSEKWTDKTGEEKRRDVVHPISSSARKQLQEAVFNAYEKHLMNGSNH